MEPENLLYWRWKTLIAGFCMRILSVLIMIMYGRMIDLPIYPVRCADSIRTMSNRECDRSHELFLEDSLPGLCIS